MAFYEENPGGITKADIVLAIPTFDEVETINFTTTQAARGLAEYFRGS
jgi:glucosylglycerate synthase